MALLKKLFGTILLLALIGFISCDSSTEDPGIDCSESDLTIEVVSSTKSDCNQPGSITVEASGGEGNYQYAVNDEDFQISAIFDEIFASDFVLSVKDDVGCVATVNFTLESEPTGISFSVSGTTSECGGATGTIEAQASGGAGTLQYALDGSSFTAINEFNNVSAGNHTVRVKDEEGCEVAKTIQIKTDISLSSNIIPIIQNDCAISGCHNGSQSPRLMTNEEVIQNATRIRSETQAGTMPRDGTLSQNEIDLIACWVDDGALNN